MGPEVHRRAERRVGTTLCRKWHLDAVIGAGGMATVYAATHRNRSRVAVKMLHPELSVDEQVRSKFLREGYVANTIGHAGAVSVIDDDETEDGTAFLVMELLTGETLEHRLLKSGGRLGPREALALIDQLLDVLASAHAKGVVHRDIKPENLFITTMGQLKVLDFGIARLRAVAASGSTRPGAFYGTPGYAPPEQARGRTDQVDARSDLYAVGATLFAMLTGRPVHDAETATERLALTISLPAPSIATIMSDLPTVLVELVDKALRYDRKERWRDAQTMLEAVRSARVRLGYPAGHSGVQRLPAIIPYVFDGLRDESRAQPQAPSVAGGTSSTVRKSVLPESETSMRRTRIVFTLAFVALAAATSLALRLRTAREAPPPQAVVELAARPGTEGTQGIVGSGNPIAEHPGTSLEPVAPAPPPEPIEPAPSSSKKPLKAPARISGVSQTKADSPASSPSARPQKSAAGRSTPTKPSEGKTTPAKGKTPTPFSWL